MKLFVALFSLLSYLAALATAVPVESTASHSEPAAHSLVERAGGPAYKALATPCTAFYPRGHPQSTTTAKKSYRPKDKFAKHLVYSWDQPLSPSTNYKTIWSQCLEQCNGLSNCKSAYMGYQIPSLPRYGGPGGVLGVGCRMYDATFTSSDYVTMLNGTYVHAIAADLENCGK